VLDLCILWRSRKTKMRNNRIVDDWIRLKRPPQRFRRHTPGTRWRPHSSRYGWRRTVYRGDGRCGKPPPQCERKTLSGGSPSLNRTFPSAKWLPPLQPDLKLDDIVPFRLSRNHFMIERRDGSYYVRDLYSTLGTIVNGEPIGQHFRGDDAPLRAGENEVIAGGVDSPFVFSVFID
jgi:hypothetical protein